MFGFNNFGKRLQSLRVKKNLTQGELADRLGVTAQAVSKWENNQSYPDITLIPTIADIFGVEVNFLFGIKTKAKAKIVFPKTYGNLNLIHQYQNKGCYSSKEVDYVDETGIKFKDGSTVELSNNLINNLGQGDIKILELDEVDIDGDESKEDKIYEFKNITSLEVETLSNKCDIKYSKDDICHVYVSGDSKFVKYVSVKESFGKLIINFEKKDLYKNNNKKGNNIILIEIPKECNKDLFLRVIGSGEINSEESFFEKGRITINGSGDIRLNEIKDCNATVNGSGDISVRKSEVANVLVNGSGDIDFGETQKMSATVNGSGDINLKRGSIISTSINGSGDFTVGNIVGEGEAVIRIAGAGDVDLGKGYLKKLDIVIRGVGEVDASSITTEKASIVIESSGEVTIGRVVESSTEQVKKNGKIKILNRGKE